MKPEDLAWWERAWKYANGVVSGEILAGPWVRAAGERFLRDLERDDLIMSRAGAVWCRFLERLPHVKGRWAARGERLVLGDWQVFCTVNLYGWMWAETGRRRFREGYIEVPRKNGKSLWMAGLGLGHMCIDGEHGAEVYCGATTERQAMEVFVPARQIVTRSAGLREQFNVDKPAPKGKAIYSMATGAKFEPVVGNPGDGASPSCGIADEFHEHSSSALVDTFTTGMGAREQPMMLYITTAGSDMGGPCYEKRADVLDILKGVVDDDSIFGVVYGLDDDDEWDTIDAQRKANPNYGVSVSEEFLAGQLAQARRSATRQNAYRTKHLNQWVGARSAWMNMLAFQACRRQSLSIEDFRGQPAIAGLDLASKVDLASMALVFEREPGRYAAFCRHYLPEATIFGEGDATPPTSNRSRYQAWHAAGWITATPGNIIDYAFIEEDLKSIGADHGLEEVAYDPLQATQFATRMLDEGVPMLEFGQTVRNFSEPMKELEAMILGKRIEFEMDPVLMWAMGNVVARVDAKDNVYPRKERGDAKIDPVVALIMAVARWMLRQEGPSFDSGYSVTVA